MFSPLFALHGSFKYFFILFPQGKTAQIMITVVYCATEIKQPPVWTHSMVIRVYVPVDTQALIVR